jgi:hypothetical protein
MALLISISLGTAHAGAMRPTPSSEAARFAGDLRAAATPSDVGGIVTELLDGLGVAVCDATGQTIGQHRGSDPGTCVYAIEIEAVSRSFLRGALLPLDALVQDWAREGLACPGSAPCDGDAVEAMLRDMRRQAEITPNGWRGFPIRLVDELGRRNDRPFSLLEPSDRSCLGSDPRKPAAAPGGAPPRAGSAGAALATIFGDIAGQAEEEGDDDVAAMFQAWQSMDDPETMMAALARGDISVLMQLMGEPETEDEEFHDAEDLDFGTDEADNMVQMAGIWQSATFGGQAAGPATMAQANQLSLELAQQGLDRSQNQLLEYSRQMRESVDPEDLGAYLRLQIGAEEAFRAFEVEQARADYHFVEWHVEVLEHIWQDPPKDESWKTERRAVLAGGADETTSCINLDSVQVLLLSLELLDMAHSVYAEGGLGR